MVCTFMLIVLPTLVLRACYSFWCWLTGKKPTVEEKSADAQVNAEQDKKIAPAAKGVCPYHVVLKFFGMKVPEKKEKKEVCPHAAQAQSKADSINAE